MESSYSIPHTRTDTYKYSIFYGIVASTVPVGNISISFLLISFTSHYVSTFPTFSVILDDCLPSLQCWPGIWHWWITAFFSSTVLYMLPLHSVWIFVSRIATGNETGSTSDIFVASPDLCETIVSRFNCSPRIPLTKAFFLVIIETLIVYRNGHENVVLHDGEISLFSTWFDLRKFGRLWLGSSAVWTRSPDSTDLGIKCSK